MWQRLLDELREDHKTFDMFCAAWTADYTRCGGKIHCARGCRNCCTLTVNATFQEVLEIAPVMTENLASRVREHAGRLLRISGASPDFKSFLRLHRQQAGFCPLLGPDGTCQTYGRRPFSCRSLLATLGSEWCGADFASLDQAAQADFMAGLDRSVVAFPMHYVAATQEVGRGLEKQAVRRMEETCGFSLYGNLPFLLFLERDHGLSAVIAEGLEATVRFFEASGLSHPYLVTLERQLDHSVV